MGSSGPALNLSNYQEPDPAFFDPVGYSPGSADGEDPDPLGSLFSGSLKFGNVGLGSSRVSHPFSTTSDNILELFPNPDTPDKPRRTPGHQNCCCTCKCREAQQGQTMEAVSIYSDGQQSRTAVNFYERWLEWSGDTSMHGIKYVFEGSKISKLLFLLFMFVFIGKLTWQLIDSVELYNSYPTGTKIQIADIEGPPTVKFPTISICNHNKVRNSYLDNNPGLSDLWEIIDGWDPARTRDLNWTNSNWLNYKDYTYAQILEEGGPPNSDMLQCSHVLHQCYENSIFGGNYLIRELSVSGNCYRINPEGLLRGKGGDYGKISLKLFTDLNEYSSTGRMLAQVGFAVVFHDHEQYSGALPTAFWMSPGMIYKVDLSLIREYRLPPPAGRCNDTVLYNTYGIHDTNSCMAQCRDDAMLEKCKCVLVPPPHPEYNKDADYRACTLQEWAECGLEHHMDWHANYSDCTRTETMCHCYPSCNETFYKASVSNSLLSDFYAESHVSALPNGYSTVRDVKRNLVVIDILFTNTQETEISEIITYGWGNFLGDVGGVLGLFLGASAFSLIEFLIFGMSITWDFFLCGWVHCMCPDLIPEPK